MANRSATYKQRTVGFGNVEQRRIIRAIEESQSRRTKRTAVHETKRKIEINPNPSTRNSDIAQDSQRKAEVDKKQDRRAQLMKWKADKEMEKRIQKMNQMPAFRAGIYHHKLNSPIFFHQSLIAVKPQKPASPRITRATAKRIAAKKDPNLQVKPPVGRKITAKNTKSSPKKNISQSSFAPVNYQFKAPQGLSPIHLFGQEALNIVKKEPKTPPVYFSPYVVSARGKKASRQERLQNITIALEIENEKRNTEAVDKSHEEEGLTPAYFRSITEKEVTRLRGLCQRWFETKTDRDVPEEARLIINQVIGQTTLLIEKKIEQFKQLISNCEDGTGENLVTPQDLQGFWDMVYLQVENCDLRFAKLTQLQEKNWVEEEAAKPKTFKPVVVSKKSAVRKKVDTTRSSSVKEMIRAARRQKIIESQKSKDVPIVIVDEPNSGLASDSSRLSAIKFDGGFFMVQSPKKALTPKSVRKSTLLQKPKFSGEDKHRRSAISLIRVSQKLKPLEIKSVEVETDPTIVYINSLQTPGRSILKQTHCGESSILKGDAETIHIRKQLVFQNESSDTESDVQEPDMENIFSPRCKTPEIEVTESQNTSLRKEVIIDITSTTKRSHRRMLNELNKEPVAECPHIEAKYCETLNRRENLQESDNQKENERPKNLDLLKRRRSARKSVKFTGDACTACSEVKVYPMTPRGKRKSSRIDKNSTKPSDDLISWDTPQDPLPRVRRSLRLQHAKQ